MTSLASVFVEVRPDTRGFSSELKASLAKSREAVDVAAKLDTKALKPQLDALKADLKSITLTKANIAVDSAQASAKLKALRSELAGLREKVKIDADTSGIKARIAQVRSEMGDITNQKATLSVDSATASAHIKAISAQLSAFDGKTATADVEVKGGRNIKDLLGGFSAIGATMSKIMTVAGAVGPAVLAVGALVTSAAAGATQMATAIGPALVGSVALGGVIKADVAEYLELIKQIKLDQQALVRSNTSVDAARASLAGTTKGTASYKSASARLTLALQDQADAQDTLNKHTQQMKREFGPLDRGIDNYKKGLQALTHETRPAVVGLMGRSLNIVAGILPRLTPLVNGSAVAVNGLVTQFAGFTKTDRFQGILDFFSRSAPVAITSLGHIVGNLGMALLNIFAIGGSGGSGPRLLGVVEKLSARFRDWTASAEGVKSISDWFKRGRDNLAAMSRLVTAVAVGLTGMGSGKALAPLIDQITNKVIPPLMEFLNNASAASALNAMVDAAASVLNVFAALSASDSSLKAFARTLDIIATTAGWVTRNIPGASAVLATFFTIMGTNQALKLVGLGGPLKALTGIIGGLGAKILVTTGFMEAETAATSMNSLATKRAAAAMAGRRAMELLAAGSAKVMAGAQWLLNAAMDANPLGLFVIGLAAVAAGLIYAYKHSETFRKIVNAAMGAVKNAAMDVVHWFTRSFIPFFTETIPNAFDVAGRFIQRKWDAATGAVVRIAKSATGWFSDHFIPFFTKTIPNAFQNTISWVRRNWPTILAILTGPIGLATLYISRHWDTITKHFKDAKDWVLGTFRTAWNRVQGMLMSPITNVRDSIQRIFGRGGPVRTAFSDAVTGIKNVWSNLSGAVRAPIRFIVNTVYNKGIVPFVNRIPFIPGTLHTIQGFDVGGYTGQGGKYEPAGIVHKNEHVIRSESTEDVNRKAPGFLDHLNKRGAEALRGVLPGFWIGGGVKPAAGAVSQHSRAKYPWAQWAGDINEPGSSDIGHPVHAWKSGVVAMVKHLLTSYGNHIRINHANNERTLYAHLSRVLVNVGQHVAQGQVIGLKGGTGNVTGPHLHFELSGGSNRIDFGGQFGRSAAPYGGPSVADAQSSLNPASWIRSLRRMGSWGGALGGMVGGVVGHLKDVVVDKIRSAVKVAGDFLLTGGTGQFTANSRGVWKALRAAGWNQAAAAGIMGNMQYESGFSPTVIQGGSHGSPAQAGSRGYGLVQWTPASKIAHMLNGRAPTVGNEVAALTGELRSGYGSLVHRMQGTKSPVNAAMAFLHEFERPANPNQPQRGLAATAWFNRFARAADGGGRLQGRGVFLKNTVLDEKVLSPRETKTHDALEPILAALQGGRGSAVFHIYDTDRKLLGSFEGIADDRVAAAEEFSGTRRRMG